MFEFVFIVLVGIILGGPCGSPTIADEAQPHSEQGQAVGPR